MRRTGPARPLTATPHPPRREPGGYMLIMLMAAIFALSIGLLVAMPVWETQIRREKEEELIFRGRQYAEAVRLYLVKHPGKFPASIDDLIEAKCLRRHFSDPVTKSGVWNLILVPPESGSFTGSSTESSLGSSGISSTRSSSGSSSNKLKEVLVVPEGSLSKVKQPRILGVVSQSTAGSLKIYNDQRSYDKWLFYYGQDPKSLPHISYLQ